MFDRMQCLYGEDFNVAQEKAEESFFSSSEPEYVVDGDKKKRKKKEKASKRKDAQKIEDISSCEQTTDLYSKDDDEEDWDERTCDSEGKLLLCDKCK